MTWKRRTYMAARALNGSWGQNESGEACALLDQPLS